MKRIHKPLSVAMLLASSTAISHAANIVWDGGGGTTDWFTATNWTGQDPEDPDNTVPGPADNSFLPGGFPSGTTISGGDVSVTAIQVRNGHALTINNSGFTVTTSGNLNMGQGVTGDGSTVNQTAGTVSLGGLSMSNNPTGGTSFYSITGGSLTAGLMNIGTDHAATFSLSGDTATVSVTDTIIAQANSMFNLTLGATGIDTINAGGQFTLVSGAGLTIDGSSYTGGAGTISLFSYTSRLDATEFSETITGFSGLNSDVVYTSTGVDLVLTAVPEPGYLGLLSIGMLALALRRRRD